MDTDLFTCINQNVVSMWEAKGECERRQEEGALKAVSLMMKWTEFRKLKVRELNSLSALLNGGRMNTSLERSRTVGHRCTAAHTLTQKHNLVHLSVLSLAETDTHTRQTRAHTSLEWESGAVLQFHLCQEGFFSLKWTGKANLKVRRSLSCKNKA